MLHGQENIELQSALLHFPEQACMQVGTCYWTALHQGILQNTEIQVELDSTAAHLPCYSLIKEPFS